MASATKVLNLEYSVPVKTFSFGSVTTLVVAFSPLASVIAGERRREQEKERGSEERRELWN
jgi:hypothetical protein